MITSETDRGSCPIAQGAQRLCPDNLDGGRGKKHGGREEPEAGTHANIWLIRFIVHQERTQHCRATIP